MAKAPGAVGDEPVAVEADGRVGRGYGDVMRVVCDCGMRGWIDV